MERHKFGREHFTGMQDRKLEVRVDHFGAELPKMTPLEPTLTEMQHREVDESELRNVRARILAEQKLVRERTGRI